MKMDRKTKRALREKSTGKPSDIQFASIIEKMNEGFVALDAQMNYVYINKRGSELLKREPENLIGKNYWDEYPEDKNTSFGQAYLRALETKTTIELEDYYPERDRWFENRVYPSDDGGLSIFFNDVTERKRAEEAMRESEERFQTLASGSPVLLWVNGLEGCEFVNREYLDFLGLTAQTDVYGYDWSQFVHPDDRETYLNAYLRAFKKQAVFSTEFRFRRKDGEYRWMRSEATPRRAGDGSFLGYVGASIDITVRKRAELALQKSEHQLRLITDAMPALISYIDSEYRYHFVNRAYREWFDYESEEVLGKTAMEVLGNAAFERLRPHMEAALAGRTEIFETETPYQRGGTRFIRATYTPDIATDGAVNGFFVLVLDITERKQAEEALAEYGRQQGALYQLTDQLQHAESLDDIFNAALDAILSALQCHRASVLLFDKAEVMRFVAWRGLSEEYRTATDGHSPWKPDEKNPEPIRMNDIHAAELGDSLKSIIRDEGIGALAFIPLVFNGKLIGKFMTYFNEPHEFTEGEMELSLTIARQLAVGIERKREENALRTSEERLRLAIQAAQMFTWELDLRTQVSTVADNFAEALGFSPDLLPNDNEEIMERFIHPEDTQVILGAFTDAVENHNDLLSVQYRILNPENGQPIWLAVSGKVIYDQNGNPERMFGIAQNITKSKQSESRLTVLSEISELTRIIEDPQELTYAIAKAVGEHLHVRRCLFNETDLERDLEIVHRDYHNGVNSAAGEHKISDYSGITSAEMAAGKTVVNNDSKIDPRTAQDYERTYALSGERAYIAVPLMGENQWIGTLWVSDDRPRQWSLEEVSLLETVAERTWNVMEKLRINSALRDKEAELEKIINGTPFMLTRCSHDLRYQFVSLAYAQMIGRTPAEITGKPIVEIMGEEGLNTISPYIEKVLRGERVEYESDVLFQDIGTRSLHIVYTPDQDEQGNIVGWFASIVDITERKRAEEELRESEARYRFIVENTSDGIWQIELKEPLPVTLPEEEQLDWYYEHAVIRQCNLGLARMYGYASVEEVLGLPLQEVMPRENPVNLELTRKFIRSGYRLVDAESREMTREGRELVFLNNMIGVIEDGKLTGEWGTNRDITERKRMEDERDQLLEREQAQRVSAEQAKLEAEQARTEAERELAERRMAEAALGEWADAPLPYEKRSPWFRYGAAFVATLLAILVRVIFDPVLGDGLALVTIYGAVGFSVWYGGVGPAILSALVGYVAITALIIDPRDVVTLNAQTITGFALFLFSNTVVMALGESMRRAQRHAHQSARVAIERQHQVEAQLQEKQLVEATLRQSEALYRGIARGIPGGGVYVLDKDFRYLVAEGPVTDAFGLSREMLEGRKVIEVFPDERGRRMEDRLRRNFAGENVEFETQANGRFYWTQMAPLHDSIGQTIILTIDITDRKQAEEALRRSEERFARFMQYLPGLAWIKDTDGRYIYANEAAAKAFKTSIEDIYGRTDEEIFPAEVAAQFMKNDELALMDEKGVQVTETLEHDDGVLHYSLVSKFPIPGPDGNTTLIGGTAIDITERKKAEDALYESEERFRAILRQATAGIVRKDAEGRLIFVNQAFCNMLGYAESELLGKTIWDFTHPDDLDENKRLYERTMIEGIPFKLEKRLIRSDASIVWVDVSVSPILDVNGIPQSAVAVEVDITGRKQAEDALRESEERYRALFNSIDEGFCVIEKVEGESEEPIDFRYIEANPAFATNAGRDDVVGQTIRQAYPGEPEEWFETYDAVLRTGESIRFERGLVTQGRVLELYAFRVKDETYARVAVLFKDITERKRAEEELQQLNLQLENRVQRRTSELLAANQSLLAEIASRQKVEDALHESRSRLQILTQRLVHVQEEERRAIARELHDRVGQSLSALNINLVILDNQISDQVAQPIRTRLDDSMQLVAETITLVRDVMSDLRPPVLDDYGLEAALQSNLSAFKSRYGIEVQFEKPEQPIPRLDASIEMTFVRIAQEALMNVARHSKASLVTLSLKQEGRRIRLSIQDNGEGIRSWQEANRPGSHGLTIMRERAEAFGGDLKVSSVSEEGTKIEAAIPIDSEGSENSKKESQK